MNLRMLFFSEREQALLASLTEVQEGRVLPLMNNLVEVVGLQDILESNGIDYRGRNFEDAPQYTLLSQHSSLVIELEKVIRDYFSEMVLPDNVTLYDEIILSLRSKDIATFNWDPFLPLAYRRNAHLKELPRLVFLHGSVGMGVCIEDRNKGYLGDNCNRCGNPFPPVKLLFPVEKKTTAWTLLFRMSGRS